MRGLSWLLAGCLMSLHALALTPSPRRELVLGTVSPRPEYFRPRLEPLIAYVAARMPGDLRPRVLLARDDAQMREYLASGRVDWIGATIASALYFQRTVGAQPVLRARVKSGSEYRSQFFVRQDSSLHSLADLRGRRIAFRTRDSTSGYYLPAAMLLEQGYVLQPLRSVRDSNDPDLLAFAFSHSESNSAAWVLTRLVDVGVINNLDLDNPKVVPPVLRAGLRVIAESPPVPLGLELLRADLEPELRSRLIEVLLASGADPQASQALSSYADASGFETLPAALAAELSSFEQRFARVEREAR